MKDKTWTIVAAFAAVYLCWGSTYLAIRYALEALPPFLMAGLRFVVAGGLMTAWSLAREGVRPSLQHWRSAFVVGGLLLAVGNGGVVWAEQRVPSGTASLLVATVPIWMVLLGGRRPGAFTLTGVTLGFAGVLALTGGASRSGDLLGCLVLMVAALSWACGSLLARRLPLPSSPWLATGVQMLAGGMLLLLAATATGELPRLAAASTFAPHSLWAIAYLVVCGSLVAFTAYNWLLQNVAPAAVSTYAYVNPMLAVFLGWAVAGESVTSSVVVAAALIVAAVMATLAGERLAVPARVAFDRPGELLIVR